MKKLFLLLLLTFSPIIKAQTENVKIQKDFESMIAYTQKNQIDKVIEMTYPRFVAVFGKEGLTGLATGMLTGMGIKAIFEENPINLKMSTISKLKDGSICMGEYDNSMILEFNDESMVSFFTMGKVDGQEIEKIDAKKIRMKGKAYLLGINDSYTKKTWKYLNYMDDLANSPEATKVISKEIITESAKLKASFKK
jgi:hypothetical protein